MPFFRPRHTWAKSPPEFLLLMSLFHTPSLSTCTGILPSSDVHHTFHTCEVNAPPPPSCHFFQRPRRKPHLWACARTPQGMLTVEDSIAAATSDMSVYKTKRCIRKNGATLPRNGKTLWRAVQRAVVCVKAQVKHGGVPCHNHSLR